MVVSIEDEFFVIDSDNLDEAQSRLYGYAVEKTGIYGGGKHDFAGVNFGGSGCYVIVQADEKSICIDQDFVGCYGLYLYESGKYFAISNSFFKLVEYLGSRCSLHVNHDYVLGLICADLCSLAYEETAINEIKLIDRNSSVHIDKPSRRLLIRRKDILINSIALDSSRALEILDSWHDKWCHILKGISDTSNNFVVNLSGGFDSRITFMLARNAGIDFLRAQIYSIKGTNPVHQDDYRIASNIVDACGAELNRPLASAGRSNLSADESVKIALYVKQLSHKKMYLQTFRHLRCRFQLHGSGGELLRSYWDMDLQSLCNKNRKIGSREFNDGAAVDAFMRIIRRSAESIAHRYGVNIDDGRLTQLIYRETRCRNHFGKSFLENYFGNNLNLAPLLDPALHQLALTSSACSDKNLLVALILVRYGEDLLSFGFEGGRSIANETLAVARSISKQKPFLQRELTREPFVNTQEPCSSSLMSSLTLADVDRYLQEFVKNSNVISDMGDEIFAWGMRGIGDPGFSSMKRWHVLAGLTRLLELTRRSA